MLIDIAAWKDRIHQDFVRLDPEQDSQVADANLSFRAPVDQVIRSFNGVLLRSAQCFFDALLCVGVQTLQVACGLLTELEPEG